MDELQAGVEFSLAVLPQPQAFLRPPKGTFDHPTLGKNNERVQFATLACCAWPL